MLFFFYQDLRTVHIRFGNKTNVDLKFKILFYDLLARLGQLKISK